MNWLRLYHGTSTDPKLHKASRAAKVSRGLFLGAWVAVLEYASQQEPRGNVADLDAATLAYLIDSPPAVAARILAAMNAAGMIEDGIIRAWAKRQRESDDVASRVRKHRQAVGDTKDRENDGGANPLNGHATAPVGNGTETRQSRAEQNREEKTPLPAAAESCDPRARAREAAAAAGIRDGEQLPLEWDVLERVEAEGRSVARAAKQLGTWKSAHPPGAYASVLADALAAADINVMAVASLKFGDERERRQRAETQGAAQAAAGRPVTAEDFFQDARRNGWGSPVGPTPGDEDRPLIEYRQ